ncbi:MAG TPA: hypothetical protein VF404_05375 [Sphingomonas sp.]
MIATLKQGITARRREARIIRWTIERDCARFLDTAELAERHDQIEAAGSILRIQAQRRSQILNTRDEIAASTRDQPREGVKRRLIRKRRDCLA